MPLSASTRCPSSFLCALSFVTLVLGACGGGQESPCLLGQTECGTRCTNLNGDIRNCGACGNICPTGTACSSAVCVEVRDTGRPDTTPPGDTGAPDTSAPDTDTPTTCTPVCSPVQRCCGITCVNRSTRDADGRDDSSFEHCGGCGEACDATKASTCAVRSGTPTCVCGRSLACSGSEVCVPDDDSFRCADLDTDPLNCGMIGGTCQEGEVCAGGECACGDGPACGGGDACCDGSCTDTSRSSSHCGGCGIMCGSGTSCEASGCVCPMAGRECRPPSDGDLGELCCDTGCVPQDASNCGSCGTACTGRTMCLETEGTFGEGEVCCVIPFGGLPPVCPPGS